MSDITQHGNVTICSVPEEEVSRRSEGVKWCFHCRARREFFLIVRAPVDRFSYYGPRALVRCGTCNTTDGDVGFGQVRYWEEEGW